MKEWLKNIREKNILKKKAQLRKDNDIEELKSWMDKRYCDLKHDAGDFWIQRIKIYKVNGEKRFYEFNTSENHPGCPRGSCRYVPEKEEGRWIHRKVDESELDDVDKLLLGEYDSELYKIRKRN